MEKRVILSVHAHPDDEASKGAALIARYSDSGVRTVLVTATGGEAGDILNPAMDTPAVRDDRPGSSLYQRVPPRPSYRAVHVARSRRRACARPPCQGIARSGQSCIPRGWPPVPLHPEEAHEITQEAPWIRILSHASATLPTDKSEFERKRVSPQANQPWLGPNCRISVASRQTAARRLQKNRQRPCLRRPSCGNFSSGIPHHPHAG